MKQIRFIGSATMTAIAVGLLALSAWPQPRPRPRPRPRLNPVPQPRPRQRPNIPTTAVVAKAPGLNGKFLLPSPQTLAKTPFSPAGILTQKAPVVDFRLPANSSQITVFKRPPIATERFALRDPQSGAPIAATDTVTTPDGRTYKAGEYYEQLNQMETDFNGLGYSLRTLPDNLLLQKTVMNVAQFEKIKTQVKSVGPQLSAQVLEQRFSPTMILPDGQKLLRAEELTPANVQAFKARNAGKAVVFERGALKVVAQRQAQMQPDVAGQAVMPGAAGARVQRARVQGARVGNVEVAPAQTGRRRVRGDAARVGNVEANTSSPKADATKIGGGGLQTKDAITKGEDSRIADLKDKLPGIGDSRIDVESLNFVPAKPKTFHKDETWNWVSGDDQFRAEVSGDITIDAKVDPTTDVSAAAISATNSEYTVTANARAGGTVFSRDVSLLDATARFYAPSNKSKSLSASAQIKVVGISVYNLNETTSTVWEKDELISKSVRWGVPFVLPLGPIVLTGEIGVQGQAGLSYDMSINRSAVVGGLGPFINVSAYGEVGLSILIAGAGVGGEIEFLEAGFNLNGSVQLHWAGNWVFIQSIYASYDLNMLKGRFYAYAWVYVPRFAIPPWEKKQWDVDVFNWGGFKTNGTIVNYWNADTFDSW